MHLLSLLIATVVVHQATATLRRRIRLPAVIRALGHGGWHFLLLGILAGLALRSDGTAGDYLPPIAQALVSVALVWVGVHVGLDFDLRRFGQAPFWRVRAEVIQVVLSLLLTGALCVLLVPYLGRLLGFPTQTGLPLLALGGYVASVKVPELLYVWRNRLLWLPPDSAASLSAVTNPSVLIVYTFVFPAVATRPVLSYGPFEAVGYFWWLAFPAILGFLTGICLDFLLRSDRDIGRCVYMSIAVVASVAGVCLTARLPGVVVGFAAGAWLVNATVRRREVVQMTERVNAVFAPVLCTFTGCLVAVEVGLDLRTPVVVAALLLFIGRGLIRTASAWASWRLTARTWRFQDTVGLAWRPAGLLALAVLAQPLTLAEDNSISHLIAPALCAVFLSQLVPLPAVREPQATQHAPQSAATAVS